MEALTNLRLLDVEVATKVMGLQVVSHKWPCGHHPDGDYKAAQFPGNQRWWAKDEGPVYVPECGEWPPDDEGYAMVAPVPFYSTDLGAAWQALDTALNTETAACFVEALMEYIDPRERRMRSPEWLLLHTLRDLTPERICLAALKALSAE